MGNGNYELSEADLCYQNRFDEIGHLHTAFNSMTVKLDTLIRQNYTNELLKKEAQLKALESQWIHTFSTTRWTLLTGEQKL